MTLPVLGLLILELRISAAELIVRNISIDLIVVQIRHICFIRKTRIGRYDRARFKDIIVDL